MCIRLGGGGGGEGGVEGQKSCLYTGGNGPSSLFRVEGCF